MNPDRARMIALDLLRLHVPEATLRFNNSAKRLGEATKYPDGHRVLTLSYRRITKLPERDVIETILHEIGHLLSTKKGHNIEWAQIVATIGGIPQTYYNAAAYREEKQ